MISSIKVLVGTGAQGRADTHKFEPGRLRPIVGCSGERTETLATYCKQYKMHRNKNTLVASKCSNAVPAQESRRSGALLWNLQVGPTTFGRKKSQVSRNTRRL